MKDELFIATKLEYGCPFPLAYFKMRNLDEVCFVKRILILRIKLA